MPVRSPTFLMVVALLAGCAVYTEPVGLQVSAEESQSSVYGGWIEMQVEEPGSISIRSGELIAVSTDSIYLLTQQKGFESVPTAVITQARLLPVRSSFWESMGATLGGWGVSGLAAGTIWMLLLDEIGDEIGNLPWEWIGFGYVFTGVPWVPALVLTAIIQPLAVRASARMYPRDGWDTFSRYARFPAGLPPGLDRSALLPNWSAGLAPQ